MTVDPLEHEVIEVDEDEVDNDFIGMDARGCSQINEQERRGNRRVWVKEEEEVLLGIMDEIVANGGRADCGSFKAGTLKNIELRLATILPNCSLRATPHIESKLKTWKKQYGEKKAYTPESLAADLEEDDNFGNEFEMPVGNFSPVSVNQTDSNQQMNQASSQPVSRKRSRSGDPIVRSMDRFTNVMKDAIDKTTDSLDKMCQVLAKSKMNENRVIADDL
ncbi:hypothetical protein Dsin_027389 [Dipteronia sinensis]|uniref:Myb/SANT-like domain-containing protein n=1 Tax=Dipteronia sinensis TaxID=43782 RepID=A0AAD9ZNF9_9ROSI|nr:hypothetical protein Dsin_027389 [Dipteronia sinensis]